MNRSRNLMFVVLTLVIAPSIALGGSIIEFKVLAYDASLDDGTGTMYLDKGLARVETKMGQNNHVTIYRGDKTLLWEIEPERWVYREMTPKDMKKIKGRIRDQIEQFEGQLSRVSREEREKLEEQFGSRIAGARELVEEKSWKKVSHKKVASDVELKDWTCEKYKLFYDGEFDDVETWVVGWEQLGMSLSDFEVASEIGKTFGPFSGNFFLLALMWSEETDGTVDGFPVRVLMYDEGSKSMRIDITGVRKEDLDPKLFELPKALDKQPLMGME